MTTLTFLNHEQPHNSLASSRLFCSTVVRCEAMQVHGLIALYLSLTGTILKVPHIPKGRGI